MKGDFSKWSFDPTDNFNGILEQQGRVGLDADTNAQTRITNHWQDTATQDVIGLGIAAIPVGEINSFKVIKADVGAGQVRLTLLPGRIWADGLLVYLKGTTEIQRVATYLQLSIQTPPGDSTSITAGIRDAVILEVWRDAENGFQIPETLIEPALGGPDTTERVHTAMALRLYRLAADQTCETLGDLLQDKFASKGKLTVSLQPTTVIPGDCPVIEGGGYTGFEHNLYRIEVAQVDSGGPMFKWSQFNGGLVGRGLFDAVTRKVMITANLQAIATSNLSNFYLEALAYDAALGHWRVTYGAAVTLNSDGELELPTTATFGTIPAAGASVFFRLWNGIAAIAQFPLGTPTPFQDGIRLEFEASSASNYTPGDYWTFPVRAGDIANPDVLINAQPPEGIRYHRVPLAELNWDTAEKPSITFKDQQIEDCRHPFRPLTNQKICCTFLVGDGMTTQGDFNSIEEALVHLPLQGGKICLLPGQHRTNVVIKDRQNIVISGCGSRSIVTPRPEKATEPIFLIDASQTIQLDQMTLMTNTGTAIQVIDSANANQGSREISILSNQMVASVHAIEIRVKEAAEDNRIRMADNQIALLDKAEAKAAIFSIADEVLIERNRVVVVPAPPDNPRIAPDPGNPTVSVFDPCTDKRLFYTPRFAAFRFLRTTFSYVANLASVAKLAYSAQGGIQIGGGSERVKIINNEVIGGRGNGITLGHIPEDAIDDATLKKSSYLFAELAPEILSKLKDLFVGFLYEITIEQNAIRQMGLSGVGVAAFFDFKIELMVSVEDLTIYRNAISHCAQQIPPDLPVSILNAVGFGGIALARCENAVMQENRIENNGTSHIEPVSGIIILMGEKIDISNNRILNNGPRTTVTDKTVRPGFRGGIVIGFGFKPVAQKQVEGQSLLFPDGIAAAKIHDNTVTQPLGQALFLIAFGPVSVVGNVLTSQGADLKANIFSFLAGSVYILNLGVSHDLLALLLLTSFSKVGSANSETFNQPVNFIPRLLYLPSGTVLFADNQVTLDLRSPEVNFAFSSQLIATLDDIAYNSNQSECSSLLDVVLTDVGLFGVTIRSNDNRFQEGVTVAFYSLFSYGFMNTATGNQATHCLHVLGTPAFTVNGQDNRVLFSSPLCNPEYQRLQQHLNVSAQATVTGGG
jgi:Family of unknown function (DUF6519)/Right handed beta helix region